MNSRNSHYVEQAYGRYRIEPKGISGYLILILGYVIINTVGKKTISSLTEKTGKRTSGIDRQIWATPESKWLAIQDLSSKGYEPKPLRRYSFQNQTKRNAH
ncbi:RNA-directed DNA polymerase [Aggregatibacter actinomycetemcomitans]|nr:RNA-directed DNA polymerase [Aggregatibacter actinomycetemcomitans]TYA48934.1 RNA-directed DNA polymerase [Aggregatibacter actinomycetemcomitans]TYA50393.1 RNA-directed DNA polymerase [Aggregatibacter actinomycetemcomitans]TYB27794.1 RNA-directed DNA polymerase [Aggregatibacter actinomycetemcomitans]